MPAEKQGSGIHEKDELAERRRKKGIRPKLTAEEAERKYQKAVATGVILPFPEFEKKLSEMRAVERRRGQQTPIPFRLRNSHEILS